MTAAEAVDANLWSGDLSDALGAIEVQAALLVRNFELLRRRGDVYGDLDKSSYLLLRTLGVTGQVDITALATALGLDPSTVGRQVAAMCEAGLVERMVGEDDRRRSVITATEKGRRRLDDTRRRRRERTAELLDGWTDDELATLAKMFRKYNNAVAGHYRLGRAT